MKYIQSDAIGLGARSILLYVQGMKQIVFTISLILMSGLQAQACLSLADQYSCQTKEGRSFFLSFEQYDGTIRASSPELAFEIIPDQRTHYTNKLDQEVYRASCHGQQLNLLQMFGGDIVAGGRLNLAIQTVLDLQGQKLSIRRRTGFKHNINWQGSDEKFHCLAN